MKRNANDDFASYFYIIYKGVVYRQNTDGCVVVTIPSGDAFESVVGPANLSDEEVLAIPPLKRVPPLKRGRGEEGMMG